MPVPSEFDEDLIDDVEDESDAVEADDAIHNSLSLPVRFVSFALKFRILGLESSSVFFFLCFMLPSSSSSFFIFSSSLIVLFSGASDDDADGSDVDGAPCPADDGGVVLPTVLIQLLPSIGGGDDGLLPVSVSVLLLPAPHPQC